MGTERRVPGNEQRAGAGRSPGRGDGRLSSARLTISFLLLGTLLSGCGGEASVERRSALLVTLDTTRADALGFTRSNMAALTPVLDALAAEASVFEHAFTVAPVTLPSHASILTGLYPVRHGIRDNGAGRLPSSAETLAERARDAGYQTAAFVAALVLDPGFGLDQGFDVYDAPLDRGTTAQTTHFAERSADRVVAAALEWLAARDRSRPFFLWVHLFDPHAPYEPPARFFTGNKNQERYRAELTFADAELGRLFAHLRDEGLWEDTVLAVVADHGESFGENGEKSHGTYLYQPTLRVPLVIRFPGPPAPARRTDVASVVDLAPTLAAAMGLGRLDVGERIDGRDLATPGAPDRGVYFESYGPYLNYGWSTMAGWLDADGKYVHSAAPEFFRWRDDPKETTNLAADVGAGALERYRAGIERVAARAPLATDRDEAAIDDALVAHLRDLGYATVGADAQALPHPLAPSSRPSPVERKNVYADLIQGLALSNAGRCEAAIPLFLAAARQEPRNVFAYENLANCLLATKRPQEAIPYLTSLVHEGPARPSHIYNLSASLWATGARDEALRVLRQGVEADPGNVRLTAQLAELEQVLADDPQQEAEGRTR